MLASLQRQVLPSLSLSLWLRPHRQIVALHINKSMEIYIDVYSNLCVCVCVGRGEYVETFVETLQV